MMLIGKEMLLGVFFAMFLTTLLLYAVKMERAKQERAKQERAKQERAKQERAKQAKIAKMIAKMKTQITDHKTGTVVAQKQLEKVTVFFNKHAYSPFWEATEELYQFLFRCTHHLDEYRTLYKNNKHDKTMVAKMPIFPQEDGVKLQQISDDLNEIVAEAQCDIGYATIYQMIKTNNILNTQTTALQSLQQVIGNMGAEISHQLSYIRNHTQDIAQHTANSAEEARKTRKLQEVGNEEARKTRKLQEVGNEEARQDREARQAREARQDEARETKDRQDREARQDEAREARQDEARETKDRQDREARQDEAREARQDRQDRESLEEARKTRKILEEMNR